MSFDIGARVPQSIDGKVVNNRTSPVRRIERQLSKLSAKVSAGKGCVTALNVNGDVAVVGSWQIIGVSGGNLSVNGEGIDAPSFEFDGPLVESEDVLSAESSVVWLRRR